MPDSNQMFGKSSGDTPDFFFFYSAYIFLDALHHLIFFLISMATPPKSITYDWKWGIYDAR